MPTLRYCTTKTVAELKRSIVANLDWYRDPSTGVTPIHDLGSRETDIEYEDFSGMLLENPKPIGDVSNSLLVFNSLKALTPHQASVERVWVYLCHTRCAEYIAMRWPVDKGNQSPETNVFNHYFVHRTRGLIRDNGIARLWWLGKIANDVDANDPELFLTIILSKPDIANNLLGRPAISMNSKKLRCFYEVMRFFWEKDDYRLFERDAFRSWMKQSNRIGGHWLLDSIPEVDEVILYNILIELAIQSIRGDEKVNEVMQAIEQRRERD